MNDRIKIAEAMGWVKTQESGGWQWYKGDRLVANRFWDPFTDANDDYAVLEWMRGQGVIGSKFATQLSQTGYGKWSIDYKIGDYARAALKVIE